MQDHEFLFDSKKQEVIEVFGTKECNDTVYLCFKKNRFAPGVSQRRARVK